MLISCWRVYATTYGSCTLTYGDDLASSMSVAIAASYWLTSMNPLAYMALSTSCRRILAFAAC